jgi:eukaryotic translation initiation factor 2C
MTIAKVAQWLCSPSPARNYEKNMPFGKLAMLLRPVLKVDKNGNQYWEKSNDFKKLRRLQRIKFYVTHRGKENNPRVYTLDAVMFSQSYGEKGADALRVTFNEKQKGQAQAKVTTIADYFERKYGRLGYPELPLLATKKGDMFPMEVCKIIPFQRYGYKLDPEQTSSMIKIAVTRPEPRRAEILNGVKRLGWDKDPYFREYGVRVDNNMLKTEARLLANPELLFGGSTRHNPKIAGRWDLRGKRFLEPNRVPLTSWGFIGCGTGDKSTVGLEDLKAFAKEFARVYKGHGGIVKTDPFVAVYPYSMDYPQMCSTAYQQTGQNFKAAPQLLFFVLSTRNELVYRRLKKNMECRLCIVTQMLQADHVRKNNAQYHSNVSMKVNAKLGGATARAIPSNEKRPDYNYFKVPTMIIGLDVTHGSPGPELKPSIAALSMSIDKTATKYCASVQTNGYKTEIIQGMVMHDMFPRLMKYWVGQNRCSPQHVYYFRDGVAEGQFSQVIDYEIKELKRIFRDGGYPVPRFTVIIATKRHHIRFFPQPKNPQTTDKNGNPLPGTLVEHDATHPFHWDFFLASHVAIQGTARPVHYHVIMDEAKCNPDELQKMIYHQCYQYIRSTTPVSLHPAVYYSHLAAERGRSHEDEAASSREIPSGKAGFPLERARTTTSVAKPPTEAPLLLAMSNPQANQTNIQHLNTTMWFV